MKKYLNKLVLLAFVALVGCSEDNEFTPPDYVTFADNRISYAVEQNGSGSFDVTVFTNKEGGSDRTFNIEVVESSTANEQSYSVPNTVTVPGGTNVGSFTVEVTDTNIDNAGETLILDLSGQDSYTGEELVINLTRDCPSNLDVDFDWEAVSPQFVGTLSGSDALVKVEGTENQYKFESGLFDFGYYCVVYEDAEPGCGEGAAGTLALVDVCGTLSYSGVDDFGDSWTISDVSVSGAELTYTWTSDYGETSTVTLTRTDNQDWPELM